MKIEANCCKIHITRTGYEDDFKIIIDYYLTMDDPGPILIASENIYQSKGNLLDLKNRIIELIGDFKGYEY